MLELLAGGAVTLTTVGLLAPHLTPEHHRELLAQARHKSKREVEALVAGPRPRPPVPATVRRLPTPRLTMAAPSVPAQPPVPAAFSPPAPSAPPEAAPSDATSARPAETGPAVPPQAVPRAVTTPDPGGTPEAPALAAVSPPALAPLPARRAVVAPLAPERYRVQFTASTETVAKLRLAQDLLRHQIPDADLGQVIDRALTALLQAPARQKRAAAARPKVSHGTAPGSRHIPAAVRRTVWARDGGRCAFVSQAGRRCTERGFLEFHHVRPYAAGGAATVENIQLRCRAHNGYEAERALGRRCPSRVREPAFCTVSVIARLPLPLARAGAG